MTAIEEAPVQDEQVKVFVRIRPLPHGTTNAVTVTHDNIVRVSKEKAKTFRFSKVFDENVSQLGVYQGTAASIVDRALGGYNGTIFAYGQSGSGKTYTMFGDLTRSDLKGIVPNVFAHIFTRMSLAGADTSSIITVTFVEIYNEEVRDLLSASRQKLEIREAAHLGVYVKHLSGYTVESMEKVLEMIDTGNRNRSTGCTKLNDRSSRSHAIFTVLIETRRPDGATTFGKLNMVDLAGSERADKSGASGDRLREAGKINMSLSVLGRVISALVDGAASHVPYRNSKLTRLLRDSLGGNCFTAMIATVSSSADHSEETYYTLMYADRVKHVRNRVTQNRSGVGVLEELQDKITSLRKQLRSLNLREKRRSKSLGDFREILEIEKQKEALLDRMLTIQRKILVGGENLMEKAHLQLELLDDASKELTHLDSSHQLLQELLNKKGEEVKLVGRQCSTLEELDKRLDCELKKAERVVDKATSLLLEKESEYQNEIGSLLYTNECLAKDMGLMRCLIENSIGKEHRDKLMENVTFDDDAGDWKMKFVASSGNNLKKRRATNKQAGNPRKTEDVYLVYQNK